MNRVTARFGTVPGGSRNSAMGRYSLAAGYRAEATQDYSTSFGFSGFICTGRMANDFNICAGTMIINDIDVGEVLSRRQLSEVDGSMKTLSQQQKTLQELSKRDMEQDAIAQDQSKTLEDLKQQLSQLLEAKSA